MFLMTRLFRVLLLASLLGLGTAAPASAQPAQAEASAADRGLPDRARAGMNQRVFDRIWNEVRRRYYDPGLHGVDWDAARAAYRPQALAATDEGELYRVLNRMLGLLDDQHASAASPAAVRRDRSRNQSRAQLGLSLRRGDDDVWRVEAVRADSPAEAAGIQAGWDLVLVGGRPWGPEVELTDGQPVSVDLRDETGVDHRLTVTPVMMEALPLFLADRSRPGLLILTVRGFEPGLGDWMGEQLRGLPADRAVVLDLRGNPGGRLSQAEQVLSCFLPRDTPWAVRTDRERRVFAMRTEAPCGALAEPVANPLAVLIDAGSRSAAELTPAALREAGRAVVVGEASPGSVLIAQETPLPDGGRLTLSRADFTTAGGVRLEKRGVTPDVVAPVSLQDRRARRDPGLEAAVRAVTGQASIAADAA